MTGQQIADRAHVVAVVDRAVDAVPVHRHRDRLAHAHVGQVRPRRVELEPPVVRQQVFADGVAVHAAELRDLRFGDRLVHVDLVRLELVEQRVGVGDDLVRDRLQARLAAPVALVRDELERRAVVPGRQHERPRRQRLGVERRAVDVGQLRQHVRRQRRIRRAAEREDAEQPGVDLLEVQRRGEVVRRDVERRDVVPAVALLDVVRGVHHGAPRELQVARVVRRAVGPRHPFAHVQHDRLAVFADAAVLQRRHLGRGSRQKIAFRIVAKQRFVDEVRELVRGVGVREHLVEVVGLFAGAADDEVSRMRPRVAPAGRRRRLVGLGARAEQHGARGEHGQELMHAEPRFSPARARSRRRARAARCGSRRRTAGPSRRARVRSRLALAPRSQSRVLSAMPDDAAPASPCAHSDSYVRISAR